MSGLLVGELQRLLARRLVRVLALLAVLGIALAGVLTFVNTRDLSDADIARHQQEVQARVDNCLRNLGSAPTDEPDAPSRRRICESVASHNADIQDERFRVRDLDGVFQGTAAPLAIVAWLIGASSMGADWQSRSITTLLTWEPRRLRVLAAKALTAALIAFAFAVLVQALLGGALAPSALLHGDTTGTGGRWFGSVVGVTLRSASLASIFAVVGLSIATVGRSTAAALGVGFAYVLVIENVVGTLLAGMRRWLLLGNSIVFISGESSGGDEGIEGRSVLGAGVFLALLAVGLFFAAHAFFRQRDVA